MKLPPPPPRIPTATIVAVLVMVTAGCRPKLANVPPRNGDVCCFGDSLVAGVGAGGSEHSYPAQLAELLGRQVIAWGKAGDTTADGLAKCARFKKGQFGIIIVTLGGNDILQRIDWKETEGNLREIFRQLRATGAVIAFTGVTGPLNPTRSKLYRKLCRQEGVLFIPGILKGIKNKPEFKSDEIHPNARGYGMMAQRVADALRAAGLLQEKQP